MTFVRIVQSAGDGTATTSLTWSDSSGSYSVAVPQSINFNVTLPACDSLIIARTDGGFAPVDLSGPGAYSVHLTDSAPIVTPEDSPGAALLWFGWFCFWALFVWRVLP